MESLKQKIKISILWIVFAVCSSAGMIIWFIEPGVLEEIMKSGTMVGIELSPAAIFFFALWWFIPLAMSFLTQILNYSLNRWTNIIMGSFWTLVTIYEIINRIVTEWVRIPVFLILLLMLTAAILIIYYALRLPKEEM